MDPKGVKFEYDGFDWRGLTLFLISIAGVLLCLLIVWPFLPGMTAAVVLATVTERPHRWLSRRLKGRTLSATVALVLVILSVVTPTI